MPILDFFNQNFKPCCGIFAENEDSKGTGGALPYKPIWGVPFFRVYKFLNLV